MGRRRIDGWMKEVAAAGILACAALPACAGKGGDSEAPAPPPAIAVQDDAGATVALDRPAERVVSLVPSVTETIIALGAADRIVGRTRYDTAPELVQVPSLGGGLDPGVESIVGLRPDLVIGWGSADTRGLREQLERADIRFYAARIEDTTAVHRTFHRMGALLGRAAAADSLSEGLRDSLAAVAGSSSGERPSVFFAIPGQPPRTAGPHTFVAQLVDFAGGRPALQDLDGDWPLVSLEAVVAAQPDVIVIPHAGGDAAALDELAGRPGWRDLAAVREGRVVAVPPDLFVRPGPHLGRAARALQAALVRVVP